MPEEITLPRRAALHVVTIVSVFTLIVIAATRLSATIEYYYSWEPLAERSFPWHVLFHFGIYQYVWCLMLAVLIWGVWLLSTPLVSVRHLIVFVSTIGNMATGWGLWTVWTIYYLNDLEWQKFLESVP